MSVGIGSKSTLSYVVETTYGTFPTSQAGTGINFNTESIQNTRNTFKSEEINPSRVVTAIRSGNVQAAGDVMSEFAVNVHGVWLCHALTCTDTKTTITPASFTNSGAVTRGSYYKTGTLTYLCTRSGTVAADIETTGAPTSVDSGEEVLSGTAYLQYYGVNATAVYQHILTAGVTKPVGGIAVERKVEAGTTDQYFRYTGGRINTWALNVPQEGIVTNTFGFLFLDLDSVATATIFTGVPTITADEPFAGSECVIQLKAPGGSYTDDFSLNTLSLNLTNNYDASVFTVGQKKRRDLPEGRREITGSFSAYFEDVTKFNYFRNESIVGMLITMNHQGTFASIELPSVKLTGSPTPNVSGNGVMSTAFNFEAFSNSGGTDIEIKLKNSNSAAYV